MSRDLPAEDPLIRMQRDLKRAQKKKPSDIKWGMVIDIAKCIGCHACTIGCVAENKLPPGVVYRVVLEEETGHYPYVRRRFVPRPCLHCQNPPCVKACPVTATYKDEQGVVVMNYERCIGCRYCLVACPYAARTADFAEWYTAETAELPGKLYSQKAAANGYEAAPGGGIRQEVARPGPRLPGGQRPQVPLLPAPPEGGHAAGLRHLVRRPGHHLRGPHRPQKPGVRNDRLPPGLPAEGRTGDASLPSIT